MKLLRICISTLFVLVIAGCWNSKAQFQAFLQEGQARGVPLIIYDISANDPDRLRPEPFAVALLNTQDKEISSVELTVVTCGVETAAPGSQTLDLGGPFEPQTAAVLSLLSDPDQNGRRNRLMESHLVIDGITVTDAAGTRKFEGGAVAKLLDPKIANYCITHGM